MRIVFVLLFALVISGKVAAQLHDIQWTLGPSMSVIDFRNDTIKTRLIANQFNTILTSASICDEIGELLYITNGISIRDASGNIVKNGDSLNPCPYTQQWSSNGLNIQQAALFLPMPGYNDFYLLFHFSNDTLNDSRPGTLHYSAIDKQANFGQGEVVQKNSVVFKGILRGGGMTACKHANGRDWWIIIGASNNNNFHKFLLTKGDIFGPYEQAIGPAYKLPYDNAYSCFSPDGSKFATSAFEGYITVFDFDRCTGELSNPIKIYNNTSKDPINHPLTGAASIAFSPSGRLLYATNSNDLNQYDLLQTNIQDSVMIYNADSTNPNGIHFVQLAPNGKIYVSTWGGGQKFLHVISKPDNEGKSCDFIYAGLTTLSANSINLPNLPNYRLGPLIGSACDTIPTDVADLAKANQLRIQPNPADKFIYAEMPMQGDYEMQLLNEAGQLVKTSTTHQVDTFNTEDLPDGIYFLNVSDRKRNDVVSTQRVVVKH